MANAPAVRLMPEGLTLRVRVRPGSSKDAVEGVVSGELQVRLRARPVKGAANAALIALLADRSGVAKRSIRILSGQTARSKIVRIETQDGETVLQRLIEPGT